MSAPAGQWTVHRSPGLVSAAQCAQLRRLLSSSALAARGLSLRSGVTGSACEVPIASHPAFAALAQRLSIWVGLPLDADHTLRFRDCRKGQGHPPHHDDYPIEGRWLVATAAVYLDACEGGATAFPEAQIRVEPEPGLAVAWLNLDASGQPVPEALHGMDPVRRGRRRALFCFFYASAQAVGEAAAEGQHTVPQPLVAGLHPVEVARWPVPRTLHLVVSDNLPDETRRSLVDAAAARRLAVVEYDPDENRTLTARATPGDLLYSPSTSDASRRLERALWQPGVGCFDAGPDGPYAELHQPQELMQLRAVPMPRSATLSEVDDTTVTRLVQTLGGLPVVVKVSGGEGGVGVMRADTVEGLLSLLEFLVSRGHRPQVQAFVADAMHWRVVVVGQRVVATYKNPIKSKDFRSIPSDDAADYGTTAPAAVEAAALAATAALRLEFAGVDVLEHPSGRVYVLEANSPCYHPQAEYYGVDVGGPMVDHLICLAERAQAALLAAR